VDKDAIAPSEPSSDRPGTKPSRDPIDLGEDTRQGDFLAYVRRVAQARFVMRKVLRILDDCAKKHGLEGLEHQALLQIGGTPTGSIAIHLLADRLDIVPAFASRLVKQLEARNLIERSTLAADKRVTLTSVSAAGIALLRAVDEDVHYQMAHFQRGIGPEDRVAAMAIFAFYVGESADSNVATAIRTSLGDLRSRSGRSGSPADP
jgi:DNA-binding MarR family transcriptional regulator